MSTNLTDQGTSKYVQSLRHDQQRSGDPRPHRRFNRMGNLPLATEIYPGYPAPIVRDGAEGRELVSAGWGMPSPKFVLEGKKRDPGVTNIRNVVSPHWRRWLGTDHRCLVPMTVFSENESLPDGSHPPVWFAQSGEPLMMFAGIWTEWTATWKVKDGEVTGDRFGFLTTTPNAVVGPIHPKAMPVILTEPEEFDMWLSAPWDIAKELQRPLPDDTLESSVAANAAELATSGHCLTSSKDGYRPHFGHMLDELKYREATIHFRCYRSASFATYAFVLRQGLKGEHILAVCLVCAVSDAIFVVGVTSFGRIASWLPWVDPVMRIGGAAFLTWYGAKSLMSALRSTSTLSVEGDRSAKPLMPTLLTCLALTWLNPHVYLDTVVLLGSISTQFGGQQFAFTAGAVTGSFLFFFALGFGAALLPPIFANPSAWRILEATIAFVMWAIALKLITGS